MNRRAESCCQTITRKSLPSMMCQALSIIPFEIEGLRIVNPALLAEPKWSAFNAADWDVLNPSAARRHVDGIVYDALGLKPGEREAVHAGLAELVGNRKRRARRVGCPASAAAQPPTERPRFEVVPISGGYAPGVNDDNLKDILNEMEDEYLMRKLGL